MDGMKRESKRDTTRLVWEPVFEELMCEKCGAILYWNFGFRRCPYCGRDIESAEERRMKVRPRSGNGAIIR